MGRRRRTRASDLRDLIRGKKPDERRGGPGGKVGKKQFSIDGKSWDYRDPRNQAAIDRSNQNRERGRNTINPQSIAKFDELYDYDFGSVRDAAKKLGIGNVDEKKEVRKILKYLQGDRSSSKPEPKSDPKPQPKPEIKIPDSPYDRPPEKPPAQPTAPGANPPPGSIHYDPSPLSTTGEGGGGDEQLTDAIGRVADFGNRSTDDFFGRFLPEMEQRNKNEAEETTRSTLIGIRDFIGKVPELGDPKDLFKYYKKKIS